jgi:hypothetical protein
MLYCYFNKIKRTFPVLMTPQVGFQFTNNDTPRLTTVF